LTDIFFETDTDIFKKIFTDIWPMADLIGHETDIFADILSKCFG